jgi:hypothetical protein
MESLMDELIVGKDGGPPRVLLYGPEKIGKSTTAASAPKPVFIQTEDGLGQIDTTKFPRAKTLEEVFAQLDKVRTGNHDFYTLAIDSLDWLENLIFAWVKKESGVKSIELAAGGYGKGYIRAGEVMQSILLDRLDAIRTERNMAIILVAHARIEKVNNPPLPTYDRYVPDLHKHVLPFVNEWVDAIGFAHKKIRVEADKAKEDRFIAHALGADGGERVLRFYETPSALAGNRYGITQDLPLNWTAFQNALDPVAVGAA